MPGANAGYVRGLHTRVDHVFDQLDVRLREGALAPHHAVTVGTIRGHLQSAREHLDTAQQRVTQIMAERRFVPADRRARADQVIAAARTAAELELSTAAAQFAEFHTRLQAQTGLPRPQPADATQEAQLANLRTDIRMRLDGVPDHDLARVALELLRGHVSRGDQLAAWFLSSSDWPALYFGSRNADGVVIATYQAGLPQVLDSLTSPESKTARQALAVVDGPEGLPHVFQLAKAAMAPHVAEVQAAGAQPQSEPTGALV
jgi:hypothetical protein